jgi:hypothetical protein
MAEYRTITVSPTLKNNKINVKASLTNNRVNVKASLLTPIRYNAVNDYELLDNKPQIEGVTLVGNKTFPELNLDVISNTELEEIFSF